MVARAKNMCKNLGKTRLQARWGQKPNANAIQTPNNNRKMLGESKTRHKEGASANKEQKAAAKIFIEIRNNKKRGQRKEIESSKCTQA